MNKKKANGRANSNLTRTMLVRNYLALHHMGALLPMLTIELRLWHNVMLEFRRMACFLLYILFVSHDLLSLTVFEEK